MSVPTQPPALSIHHDDTHGERAHAALGLSLWAGPLLWASQIGSFPESPVSGLHTACEAAVSRLSPLRTNGRLPPALLTKGNSWLHQIIPARTS